MQADVSVRIQPRLRIEDFLVPGQGALLTVGMVCPSLDNEKCRVEIEVDLPAWAVGMYFAAFQKYDPMDDPGAMLWPDGYNRLQGLRVEPDGSLRDGGVMLLLQLDGGHHLCLLPMAGRNAITAFDCGAAASPTLFTTTLGPEAVPASEPMLAIGCADNALDATREAWDAAIAWTATHGGARHRHEKRYPDPLRYVGWCTWEHFRQHIDSEKLAAALDLLAGMQLPIRTVLIDDGHLAVDRLDQGMQCQRLRHWGPDATKFAKGWKDTLKRFDRFIYFGLWLNMNGYWSGISPDHELPHLAPHLRLTANGELMPGPERTDAEAFFQDMMSFARGSGFDFLKIDNQARNLAFYRGSRKAVATATQNSRVLESAAREAGLPLVNCMAHSTVNAMNTAESAVTRCSEDYLYDDVTRARRHLHNSFVNMLWLERTVWADHDMFHTTDRCAATMARSRSLSGGPVLLSDPPGQINEQIVWPLCLADGEILRPENPGLPLPCSVYQNPFDSNAPFVAGAPLNSNAAMVGVYNLTDDQRRLSFHLRPEHWREVIKMSSSVSPTCGVDEPASLAVYCHRHQQSWLLQEDKSIPIQLASFVDDALFVLVPDRLGWAVIGCINKYLSPLCANVIDINSHRIQLELACPGQYLFWSTSSEPLEARLGDGRRVQLIPGKNGFYLTESLACESPLTRELTISRLD